MANADEFCQFARLGQTSKIQKCLQTHSVDINALNLYGESALSTATYYNQVLCVEYLLANKAEPKLRLTAGHTAVHIACRSANLPILHMLLSVKKEENNEEDGQQQQQRQQEKEDKHVYECLRIKDYSNLTPVHWAATQESVSKRQKLFAYLDKRMPGVLDSRYNSNWFHSWTKTHPWVIEQKLIKNTQEVALIRLLPKLTNTDKVYRQYCEPGSSLPLTDVTHFDVASRASLNDGYERTPILPLTATTNSCYEHSHGKDMRISPKERLIHTEHPSQTFSLPPTPITSRIVTSKHPLFKSELQEVPNKQKSSHNENNLSARSQKTPYAQRISTIVKHSLSPLSDHSTYRAERAHVIPTFNYPPSPPTLETKSNKGHDYEDMVTPISSKRPSHNLLSNIVPSTSTSSSEQSSRQSSKPFASFGFDTSMDRRSQNDTTNFETYTQNDDESFDEDDQRHYEINQFDYLCNSASTLGISSPGAYNYDL